MVFKRTLLIVMLVVYVISFPLAASAEAPYRGYNYNYWGQSVPAPNGYIPDRIYTGEQLGAGRLNKPQDMFIWKNGDIYILDSGNNRIVVLDSDMKLKKVIDSFMSENGDESLNDPKGICLDNDGNIYIADKGNGRIVVMDDSGFIFKVVGKPVSDILSPDFNYQPEKVAVDSSKNIYVLAYGIYQGLIAFDQNGKFHGFFGSNRVEISLSALADRFWKRILSRKQREAMVRYVPVEYSNLDVSEDDFIYTSTRSILIDEIKKLNPMGVNILVPRSTSPNARNFGDIEFEYLKGKMLDTTFVDINVDNDGIISALDSERGRIFQYDQECNLLFIFGGIGEQIGTFRSPVAVESINGQILVLDSEKNNITSFSITDFGIWVREAVQLYDEGKYDEAIVPWQEVLKRNANYELAYIGIGKALMKIEKYGEAMKYFKLGYDKKGYSEAFKEYRTLLLRNNFSVFALIVFLVFFIPWLITKRNKLKHYFGKKVVS